MAKNPITCGGFDIDTNTLRVVTKQGGWIIPNFCGGIRLDGVTLKAINGVICEATADSVNVDDVVSTCVQLWDGASFKVDRVHHAVARHQWWRQGVS